MAVGDKTKALDLNARELLMLGLLVVGLVLLGSGPISYLL